ncbi:FAD binding domain-containing protein [Coniochaeta sp. 2T2.1]|nr:FAD binding domain-containing protein [Coniochaeta sp. 2T2.1]
MSPTIETDVLIVGAGPAGASLGCFLTKYSVKGLIISKASATVQTPRSHYTNNATFECLRDVGLEQECRARATPKELMMFSRICQTMAGEELSRTYNCGSNPERYGEFKLASPCEQADLPQSVLEPILLRMTTQNGFKIRWDMQFVECHEDPETGKMHSVILDLMTQERITIISKYLCGADGARSAVARELQLPFNDQSPGGLALNVLVEADMDHLLQKASPGLIHILLKSDKPQPDFCALAIARFVKPFTEWVFVMLAKPGVTEIKASPDEIVAHVKDLIGDPSVAVKLKRLSTWTVNECYAEQYSRGNAFCLGDAVHRHPPFNGLGSNTSIQDAYNLAWKIGYVIRGMASPLLLETYSMERQPIGKKIVRRANDTGRMHAKLFTILKVQDADVSEKQRVLDQLKEDSREASELRAALQKLIEDLDVERHGFGAEMNQQYQSPAVWAGDESCRPPHFEDPDYADLHYVESTYPGFRLPHAWLRRPLAMSTEPMISTHDLAGKGRFTILTGIGGKPRWEDAAATVARVLSVKIAVYSIGWHEDYRDVFFHWAKKRGVGEKGAVLVRPDRVVAWRCVDAEPDSGNCGDKLLEIMSRIL